MGCLNDEANMKQTRSKLRAHVVYVYIQCICFMFASSCKHRYYFIRARCTMVHDLGSAEPTVDQELNWVNYEAKIKLRSLLAYNK